MEQGQGMSDNIKELVSRLRAFCTETRAINVRDVHVAADALEALTQERDQMLIDLEEYRRDVEVLTEERDRLKAALEAKQTDPASAVCVWTRTPYTAMYSSTCCDENYLHKVTASGMCHRCDKPIKFTEAKE